MALGESLKFADIFDFSEWCSRGCWECVHQLLPLL